MLQSRRLMLFFVAMLAAGGASAQSWPTKPVRVVVPFAAGGPADGLARFLGTKMAADLGQSVLVDNKAGAGGTIGAAEVAKSAADGYTLLFSSTGALVIFPALSTQLPYNPDKDLVAVGHAVNSPLVIVTHAKSPFQTLGDLVKFARANPGKLNFASAGNATTTQLGAELLKREAKIFMTHIPYRGAAPAITDLIAGTVDLMVADIPAAVGFIKSGQLRALAVADPKRSSALPEVPTTAEAGYKDTVVSTWYGLMAPAGTPPDVIARLNAALVKALAHSDTGVFLKAQGSEPVGGGPATFGTFVRAESVKWGTLAKGIGLKLD